MPKYIFCIPKMNFYTYMSKMITVVNNACKGATFCFLEMKDEIEIQIDCVDEPKIGNLCEHLIQHGIRLRKAEQEC